MRRPLAALCAGSLLVLAAAGCSSGSASSSAVATAPVATAPVATATGAAGTTPSSQASVSADVTAAKDFIAQYTGTPTKIGPTVPLKTKPTRHTFVYMECDIATCTAVAKGLTAATAAAGWTLKIIPYQAANSATLVSGLQQALRYHPVAVAIPGTPQSLWQSVIPQYQAAKTIIIPQQTGPVSFSSAVPVSVGDDGTLTGKIVGDWVVSDSGGTGHALIASVPEYPTLTETENGMVAALSACSGCKVTKLDATIAEQQSNGIVPAIVSALKRDPTIKYVLTTVGVYMTGLPAALQAAGITGVKVAGALADAQNEQDMLNGQQGAFTTYNTGYIGWQLVDVALRKAEGMAIPAADNGQPEQIVTAKTVGTPSDSSNAPSDYAQQFERLWHVSG